MRLLHERYGRVDVFTFEVPALESEGFMGPDALDDAQRFQSHLAFLLPGYVVGSEAEWSDAGTESAFQAALG